MGNKIKHLEFIQTIINRMAANSFLIKGWAITLVAALFALSSKDTNKNYIIISFYRCYDWVYDRGYENLGDWIEKAAKDAGR